jgi:serine/threonine protein kinase
VQDRHLRAPLSELSCDVLREGLFRNFFDLLIEVPQRFRIGDRTSGDDVAHEFDRGGKMNESTIFEQALEKSEGAEREQFLAQACGDDAQLRQRVDALLLAHANPDSFLDAPAERFIGGELSETILIEVERAGKTIGPYKLLQQIGEGGMGIVFLAEQTEPIKRRVALKIVKPGVDTREVIARFEAERQALAMMDHPNIARVFDAGTTEHGRPYFVMELVNGLPLTNYCDQHNLTTRERLKLFATVCHAVQHAHQKGIIHRDLKPGNILVADHDNQAVPKVIDFGVAKATNQQLTEKTLFTQLGQIVGTLEYMSPEQAKRNQLDVDTRSDIYSLGIVLYELLTGETPLNKQSLRSAAFEEILRLIREEEPPLPSLKLSESQEIGTVAAHRCVDPGKLRSLIRGDLDWIVLKTLQKDRAGRYATAQELADDVRRHLDDLPIHARPPRVTDRIRKFLRRNSWQSMTSIVVVALAVSAAWSFSESHRVMQDQINARSGRASAAIEATSLTLGQAINSPVGNMSEWKAVDASVQRINDLLAEGSVLNEVRERAESLIAKAGEARTERDIAERLENVLITSASHPDKQSWRNMERQLAAILADNGIDLDNDEPMNVALKIRDHRFAVRFADILELWIGTKAYIGGPDGSQDALEPWAQAIYKADNDPLRTGIRQLIYAAKPVAREQIDELIRDFDLTIVSPRTLSWLSSVYGMAGMADEADQLIRNTLRRHPSDVMLNFDYGYSLSHQKRWQEAIRMYSRALALRPDAAGIWRMMGIALQKVDEPENACEAFQRACEIEDDYGPTWASLGNALLTLERSDEALKSGRRLIEMMPDHPDGYGIAGRALMQQKSFNEALVLLEKCDEVRSNYPAWQQTSKRWIAECKRLLEQASAPQEAPMK